MSEIKRIPIHTVKNILADSLVRAGEFDSVVVIAVTKEGDVSIGRSDQSGADLAYSLVKFQGYVDSKLNSDSYGL